MAVSKPQRIVMHWTAGEYEISDSDYEKYHEVVEGDGTRRLCRRRPEANNDVNDGDYAAHVRAKNTGSIGLAMCCMKGAKERPFHKGKFPMTEVQLGAFINMVAEYAETYDIAVDRRHVLSHEEVDVTLKVPQDKWDIMWLPHMAKPGNVVEVGDFLRERIEAARAKKFDRSDSFLASLNEDDLVERIVARIKEELA
ncbi:N-acetylmuramoyl-L-alanine amidase [Phaeobacter sp. 22II1-1F12B]|uniref:N-acetylmuramoyl-L-alanine amidase n=1 Tax=Phaeobacter sp. 22II1-1F12B TaxID=1317111 RepID=UPI000B525A05|nr:N-acetylmuramoyl-L-alanine amidase [Phaeobacter sp. 22II1-1F12B]